jgi:hypothetical protein
VVKLDFLSRALKKVNCVGVSVAAIASDYGVIIRPQ